MLHTIRVADTKYAAIRWEDLWTPGYTDETVQRYLSDQETCKLPYRFKRWRRHMIECRHMELLISGKMQI